jgi:hypothetical protein
MANDKRIKFLTVFTGSSCSYSFGRVFSGLIVIVALVILSLSVRHDYMYPTKPVVMTKYDVATHSSYQESILVKDVNWSGYGTFLTSMTLFASAIFGLTKVGEFGKNWAENRPGVNGNGSTTKPLIQ